MDLSLKQFRQKITETMGKTPAELEVYYASLAEKYKEKRDGL